MPGAATGPSNRDAEYLLGIAVRQDFAVAVSYQDHILEAYTTPAGYIDPRLDRNNRTCADGFIGGDGVLHFRIGSAKGSYRRELMNCQAYTMTKPMHRLVDMAAIQQNLPGGGIYFTPPAYTLL